MTFDNQELFMRFEKQYWNLSRNMSYIWRDIFECRFPGSQSHILFLLDRNGRKRMSEVADILHLTPGAVTIASEKLIEQGYISRIRDEQDRRVIYLELNEKGKDAISELQNEGKKAMKMVFKHLTTDDLEHLIKTFQEANQNIDHCMKGE